MERRSLCLKIILIFATLNTIFLVSTIFKPEEINIKDINSRKKTDLNTFSMEQNNLFGNIPKTATVTPKLHDIKPQYAYGFYAASRYHLKAAIVNINRLKRFGSLHVDYLIYTNIKPIATLDSDVRLIPYVKLPSPNGYYDDCMTKILFFNMTAYRRIVYIDVDALVVKSLDILFSLPSVRLASPVAYWEDEPCFTSALLVIEPDYTTWANLRREMDTVVKNSKADMNLLNIYYQHKLGVHAKTFPELLLLPGYFLVLSSHFRERIHGRNEKREAVNIYPFPDIDALAKQAYVIHFSGQPKPWSLTKQMLQKYDAISTYFYDYNLEFKTEFDNITI